MLEAVRWARGIQEIHRRIEARFYRSEPRRWALAYLKGLLSPVERKNGGNRRGRRGCYTRRGAVPVVQLRLGRGPVRDDLWDCVVEHLGEADGVLVMDETGFLKKGSKSVGVQWDSGAD